MKDFTLKKYKELLKALINQDYSFQTFQNFLVEPEEKVVILRHDVDLLPQNSLRFAQIQYNLGLAGSYYFRAVPESWDERIIKQIDEMGHEVGYHYETMDTAKGDIDLAMSQFKENLKKLRNLVDVKTICMHGSPRSKYDNKDVWKKYDYKELGITGEPYFDVNYEKVFYLTDTGRRWDGHKFSVRDKVKTSFDKTYRSTDQIIKALKEKELSDQIMITMHPQRWSDDLVPWTKELIAQNIKNAIKRKFFIDTT